MFWLDVELPAVATTPRVEDGSLELLDGYRRRWRVRVWDPYHAKRGAQRTLKFEVLIATHDPAEAFSREQFELETTERFFDQLTELYLSAGLEAVYQLARHVNSTAGGLTFHTRDFVNMSVAVLEELIAGRLREIERDATTAAREQIYAQIAAVKSMRACFEKRQDRQWELFVGRLKRTGAPPPIGAKDRLYELFQQCFELKRGIDRHQRTIDE